MEVIVSDKDIKIDDLSDLRGGNDKGIVKRSGRGPGKGEGRGENIDSLTKEFIAIDGASGLSTQKELAAIYGVTQTTVSHLSNGKLGTGRNTEVDPELGETVKRVKEKIEGSAVDKLMETLDFYDPSALKNQLEVVTAAQKLASVVEKIKGREKEGKNNISIVFYNPRQRDINSYEVVEVER